MQDKQKYGINVAFFQINFIRKRFNKFQDKLRYKKQLVWYSGSQENLKNVKYRVVLLALHFII